MLGSARAVAQPDFCFGWGTTLGVARNLCWRTDNRGAEGAEIETPKASRGKGMGCPPHQPTRGPGGAS